MEQVDFIPGMRLGAGFNSATLDVRPTPALSNLDAILNAPGGSGQKVKFSLDLASSTESLAKKLGSIAESRS